MRALIFAAAVITLTGAASAQTPSAAAPAAAPAAAAAVKVGDVIRTSDGRRVGRVDRIETRGNQQVASIIYQSRVVHVPVTTISNADGGLTTSLARTDLK